MLVIIRYMTTLPDSNASPSTPLAMSGIGTGAPSQRLHVSGQAFIKATGSADYVMRLEGAKGNPQLELAPFAADFSSNIYAGLSGTADTFLNLICNKSFAVCTGTQDKTGGSNKRFTIDQAGDATFSGTVSANGALIDRGIYRPGADCAGIRLSNQNSILPANGSGTQVSDTISLGDTGNKFKDAYFSGAVSAGNLRTGVAVLGDLGTGLRFGGGSIYPCDQNGNVSPQRKTGLLGDDSWRFKDAHFSGTVEC